MALFGYATVIATAQSAVQGAQACFLEYSACLITASYFANGSTDAVPIPLTPNTVAWRLDDIASGEQILGWTVLTPATSNQVAVNSTQNKMINLSRCSECHQALFKVQDSGGNVCYARCVFDLLRVPGVP
jgi:hypothetical protein